MTRQVTFSSLSWQEKRDWIRTHRTALQRKMQREQAYLERRARRGVRTPTDDAYEADRQLEADMVALLDEMEYLLVKGYFEEGL